jgi:hypothetical protein
VGHQNHPLRFSSRQFGYEVPGVAAKLTPSAVLLCFNPELGQGPAYDVRDFTLLERRAGDPAELNQGLLQALT